MPPRRSSRVIDVEHEIALRFHDVARGDCGCRRQAAKRLGIGVSADKARIVQSGCIGFKVGKDKA